MLAETYSWDTLAQQVAHDADLDPVIKARCEAGIASLRRYLGDGWPLSDIAAGHPLLECFTNRAPFTRTYVAHLGEAMDLLARLDGWPALLARLRQSREGPAALLELELAYPPLSRGWGVELGPATQPGRFADLRISRGEGRRQRNLYIEASIVDDFSLHARDDMSFQDRLVPYLQLLVAGLEVGGRLHIDPTLDQEEELLAIATRFWRTCVQNRHPSDLVIPGILELWAVPQGDEDAKRAMISRGHQDGFVGGVVDNPLKRLLRVARTKLGQLPLDEPGLIVLQPPSMLFRSFPLEVIVPAIRQQLAESPAVAGVGLMQWIIQGGRRVARVRHHPSGVTVLSVSDRLIWLKQLGLVTNSVHTNARSLTFITQLL